MPEISRFYGIVIKMYYNDHAPPHLHAEYGSAEMLVGIDSLTVIAGKLPARATGLVLNGPRFIKAYCKRGGTKHVRHSRLIGLIHCLNAQRRPLLRHSTM